VDLGLARAVTDLATAKPEACAAHRDTEFAHPEGGVVRCMDALKLTMQELITKPACRRWLISCGAMAAAGDEPTLRVTDV
jgi:hypothetical protein